MFTPEAFAKTTHILLPALPAATRTPQALATARPASAQVQRKSEQIGLDFSYDWSNPAISDSALIAAVPGRARFMDVSKIFAYFGAAQVQQGAAQMGIDLHTGCWVL